MNISGLIYKVTGKMTRKQVMRSAESVGHDLIQRAREQGDTIQIKDIKDILVNKLGKKKASKIIISDSLEEFKAFAKKHLKFSDEMAEAFYYSTKGAALPGGADMKKSFFKINFANFEGLNEIVNTISHECEHLFFQNFSFRNLIEKTYAKFKGKKWLNNYIEKYANIINEKASILQQSLVLISKVGQDACGGFTKHKNNIQGLLQQMELPTFRVQNLHKGLQEMIEELLIVPNDDKLSLKILKAMRTLLKDESRAYKVGGRVERSLYPKTDRATKSEMLATLYDETIKVLNTEIKTRRKDKFRKFFGLCTQKNPA